jgi:hypothetical protein
MEKEFIPHTEALALKELGFDEPCFGHYIISIKKTNKGKVYLRTEPLDYDDLYLEYFQRNIPLYQQAFRWFRERYGLMHIINPYNFTAEIDYLNDKIIDKKYGDFIPHEHLIDEDGENKHHSSYEEAELECLKKLIEIVKNG